jgi:hypothetical protein
MATMTTEVGSDPPGNCALAVPLVVPRLFKSRPKSFQRALGREVLTCVVGVWLYPIALCQSDGCASLRGAERP